MKYTKLDVCQVYKLLSGRDYGKLLDDVNAERKLKVIWQQLNKLY